MGGEHGAWWRPRAPPRAPPRAQGLVNPRRGRGPRGAGLSVVGEPSQRPAIGLTLTGLVWRGLPKCGAVQENVEWFKRIF